MVTGPKALRDWRRRKNMTQADAAAAFGASSFMQVSRWERGETSPVRSMAAVIERVTDGDVAVTAWDHEDSTGDAA